MASRLTMNQISRRFLSTIFKSTSRLGLHLTAAERPMVWGMLKRMGRMEQSHKNCKHKGEEGTYCGKCGKQLRGDGLAQEQSHKDRGIARYLGVLTIAAACDDLFDHLERHKRKIKRKTFSEEEWNALREQFESRMEGLPTALRKGLDEMKTHLRRHGGPGRRAKLSRSQQIEVCEHVSRMQKVNSAPLPDIFKAVKEATLKTKGIAISSQTVKRIWQRRRELYS